MKITAIADLHGHKPELPGGDLLIVAGDLTAWDRDREYVEFFDWFQTQDYQKKILIGGNHDNGLVGKTQWPDWCEYLFDSGTEYAGLKIWGSPWTPIFSGQNKKYMAFGLYESELSEKFETIPEGLDILITHGPPFGILDRCVWGSRRVGSLALLNRLQEVKPKIHVFGHIHESYGHCAHENTKFYNVAIMDSHYEPTNPVTNIQL